MPTCEWEGSGIVVESGSRCLSLWVTSQTGRIAIHIATYSLVLIIGFRIMMTGNTNYLTIIGWVVMTIDALCPLPVVTATIDWEKLTIVVKIGWHPTLLTVTCCTIRRELGCLVVGVGSGKVVVIVTAGTSVGSVGIITIMTSCTIIGYTGVSTIQRVILVVNTKSCRSPTGSCSMT